MCFPDIPLGPGQEAARGTTQTKEITPIIAQAPTPITKEYIAAHWVKRRWVALIEAVSASSSVPTP